VGGWCEIGEGDADKPEATTVRKTLQLAPRTKPVGEVAAPVAAASSIFGDAKPRDEAAVEEARRKLKAEKKSAAAAAESGGGGGGGGEGQERPAAKSAKAPRKAADATGGSPNASERPPKSAGPSKKPAVSKGQDGDKPPHKTDKPKQKKVRVPCPWLVIILSSTWVEAGDAYTYLLLSTLRMTTYNLPRSLRLQPPPSRPLLLLAPYDTHPHSLINSRSLSLSRQPPFHPPVRPAAKQPSDETDEAAFNKAQNKLKEMSVAPVAPKKVLNVFENLGGDDSEDSD